MFYDAAKRDHGLPHAAIIDRRPGLVVAVDLRLDLGHGGLIRHIQLWIHQRLHAVS